MTPTNMRAEWAVLIKATPGADLTAMAPTSPPATDPFVVVQVQDREQFKGAQGQQIDMLLSVLYGLLALAVVIAILGIVNTLALSVVERRREIGMLRAVGMQRAQCAARSTSNRCSSRCSVRWWACCSVSCSAGASYALSPTRGSTRSRCRGGRCWRC